MATSYRSKAVGIQINSPPPTPGGGRFVVVVVAVAGGGESDVNGQTRRQNRRLAPAVIAVFAADESRFVVVVVAVAGGGESDVNGQTGWQNRRLAPAVVAVFAADDARAAAAARIDETQWLSSTAKRPVLPRTTSTRRD